MVQFRVFAHRIFLNIIINVYFLLSNKEYNNALVVGRCMELGETHAEGSGQ